MNKNLFSVWALSLTLVACSGEDIPPTTRVIHETPQSASPAKANPSEVPQQPEHIAPTATPPTSLSDAAKPDNAPKVLPGWERYSSSTFREIRDKFTPHVLKDGVGLFLMGPKDAPAHRIRVIYTGKSRKLTGERLTFIRTWSQSLKIDQKFSSTFANEFLFIEDEIEYWLPVQTQLISHFKKELKPGGSVTLYSIWIGANMKSEQEIDWIFLVNEFQK